MITVNVKGHCQDEQKQEKDKWHYDRKWNYHAHGEESVATCPHDKANKDDMTYIKAHQIIANILATHEAKKERKPKQIGVKPGEEMLETKSKPMISNPNSKWSIEGGGSNMQPLGHCSYQKLKKGR